MNVHEVAVHVDQYSIAVWSKRKRWTKRGQKKKHPKYAESFKGDFYGRSPLDRIKFAAFCCDSAAS